MLTTGKSMGSRSPTSFEDDGIVETRSLRKRSILAASEKKEELELSGSSKGIPMMQLKCAPESSVMKDSTSEQNISKKDEIFLYRDLPVNKSQVQNSLS